MLITTKNDLDRMDPILSKLDRVEHMIRMGTDLACAPAADIAPEQLAEGLALKSSRRYFAAAADVAREALAELELALPKLDDRHNYDCARAIFTELLATAEAK